MATVQRSAVTSPRRAGIDAIHAEADKLHSNSTGVKAEAFLSWRVAIAGMQALGSRFPEVAEV